MSAFTLAAAIFVKTPGYSSVKTRLAADVGRDAAEAFYRLAVTCVAEVVTTARELSSQTEITLSPHWAVAEAEAIDNPLWSSFRRVVQGGGGLGERLNRVYHRMLADHSGVLLLGADQPQMRPQAIVAAACDLQEFHAAGVCGFHVGRVKDGGFSLFGGTGSVAAEVWTSVMYSMATTADELIRNLRAFGEVRETDLGHDVDTLADLKRLGPELNREHSLPSQRALADWMRSVDLP